jgi:hypothetical protein
MGKLLRSAIPTRGKKKNYRKEREKRLFTLWRSREVGCYQIGLAWTDLPLARQAYEKPSHDCQFSAGEYRKSTRDLVESFQWITSEEKLLSSCAVFPTVTSSITISTTGPYL